MCTCGLENNDLPSDAEGMIVINNVGGTNGGSINGNESAACVVAKFMLSTGCE